MTLQLPLIGFVVCAFGFTWVPATLAYRDWNGCIPTQILILLASFGPLEAAILWAGVEGGRRGIKEFLTGFFVAGFNPLWYLVAMLLPLACCFCAHLIVHADEVLSGDEVLISRPAQALRQLPWLYLVSLLQSPLGEEPGWRGFALPRLLARYSPLTASLLLSLVWACWHWPMSFFLLIDDPFYLYWLDFIPITILLTWLYNRTRGSVLISIFFHTSVNVARQWWVLDADSGMESRRILFWIVAGTVVWAEGGWFRRQGRLGATKRAGGDTDTRVSGRTLGRE